MPATMLFPRTAEEGEYFERLAYMAARRARSVKTHEGLKEETFNATPERLTHFLNAIVKEEWSLDVAEMSLFVFDVYGVPSWLMIEFLRHRFIAHDWSFEQRSKRAIQGHRIPVINPFDPESEFHGRFDRLIEESHQLMLDAHKAGVPAEKMRYAAFEGTETAFFVAGNARALHHVFTLRGNSETIDGNGTAAPEFFSLIDDMFYQAQAVCPNLFETLLRS